MRYIKSALLLLSLIVTFCGCENKWPTNGDLDGMWQILTVEQNGSVKDLKATKKYWSFRKNLLQLSDVNDNKYYAHFKWTDSKLIITDLSYFSKNAVESDNNEWIPFDEREVIAPWCFSPIQDLEHPERTTQTFVIEHLDYDNMILSSGNYKIRFRKF